MEGKDSLERIFAQLSDEQKEQFKNCKDIDEVMKLADKENCDCGDCEKYKNGSVFVKE